MQSTMNDVMRIVTLDYLHSLNKANPPSPAEIEAQILSEIELEFVSKSAGPNGKPKWRIPRNLEFFQIAEILAYLYPIRRINTAGDGSDPAYDLLAIYQEDGSNQGIYVSDDETFQKIASQYNYAMTSREFNECMIRLRTLVPRTHVNRDPDLIAVNNGIFNYATKELLPFSPDYVFLSKTKVNLNKNAVNPVIHNKDDNTDWDVESWMESLSDDSEVVQLLWEILGAIIRPHVSWNKSAWFYSETGNNGKGTLCELMRELCGDGSYASIPLSDMGKDFLLEPLTRASAIIVDENDVGTFIDKAANLKAIITHDVIQINRKFKTPIPYKFYGFMVQCLNELPRIRDKSDSFFRRQLFVPFTKCFTGAERKYIKNDYLHRKDVLEYVLKKVLVDMNYDSLSEPEACILALKEYKEYNDPIRQFTEEILPECTWDILPFTFLYDLYKEWFRRNMPSGTIQNRQVFINELSNVLKYNDMWRCDKGRQLRVVTEMTACEPLIYEYDLDAWKNPKYRKGPFTIEEICTPMLNQFSSRTRGIYRIGKNPHQDDEEGEEKTCT